MGTGAKTPAPHNIPLGYGWNVRDLLGEAGIATVQHSGGWLLGGQAANTAKGVACIDHWLGGFYWDVVHVNFGLHDIDESEYVPVEQYIRNLATIHSKIQPALTRTGAFIWASSTPVPYPSEYRLRNNSAVIRYNAAAAQLWKTLPEGSVVVNDLYALIIKRCGESSLL